MLIGMTVVLTLGQPSAVESALRAEVEGILRAGIASSMTVQATYVSAGDNRSLSGYDVGSGAWYKIFDDKVFGRDQRGRCYRGRAIPGGVVYADEAEVRLGVFSDSAVEQAFPAVMMIGLRRQLDQAVSIERRSGGGYGVVFRFPMGDRAFVPERYPLEWDVSPREVAIELDDAGRLLAVTRERQRGKRERWQIAYADGSPPRFPIAAAYGPAPGWVLEAFEAFPEGRPELFDKERVERLASEVETSFDSPARYHVAGVSAREPSNAPAHIQARPLPAAEDRGAVRWPWIATGMLVIGIGVIAWWRRR